MPSILAEPFAETAPHGGRAFALAAAGLVILVTIATAIGHHHHGSRHRAHHRFHTTGRCIVDGHGIDGHGSWPR